MKFLDKMTNRILFVSLKSIAKNQSSNYFRNVIFRRLQITRKILHLISGGHKYMIVQEKTMI